MPAKANKALDLPDGADDGHGAGLAVWAVIPFQARKSRCSATSTPACCSPMAISSIGVYGVISGRLGVQLEVRVPRRDARLGADGLATKSRWALRWSIVLMAVGQPEPVRYRRLRNERGIFAAHGV